MSSGRACLFLPKSHTRIAVRAQQLRQVERPRRNVIEIFFANIGLSVAFSPC
ncbi:hypothetical protein H6CHR_03997 [Variovorax sp. PBL-H6]|nr:hypothetical protein H6CHR_03997 [Variovorax sp. PBL-H6]